MVERRYPTAILASILSVLALGCGAPNVEQAPASTDTTEIQCDENDIVFDNELTAVDQVGGPSNPEKALEKYLKRNPVTDGIPSSAFKRDKEKKNSAGELVEVELTDSEESQTAGEMDKTKARVFTQDFGQSWFVTRALFCQKYIEEKDKD